MASQDALIKPMVDAILAALKGAWNRRLKGDAKKQVSAAIRELLRADPDEDQAAARIAIARAAGHISPEALLAERMLERVRESKKRVKRKALRKPSRRRTVARAATTSPRKASGRK